MAQYKYEKYLSTSTSSAFDQTYGPGKTVPNSGIYRCEGCGHQIAANKNDPFPPQNHHQHGALSGAISWKLIVFAG